MAYAGKSWSTFALAVSVILLFLSGCRPKKNEQSHLARTLRGKELVAALDRVTEYEAKHADIPVPLSSKPVVYPIDSKSDMLLCYENDLACEAIKTFYEKEMERSGWACDAIYAGPETVLHFSKSQKFCAVSIRPRYDVRHKAVHGSGIFIATGHRVV